MITDKQVSDFLSKKVNYIPTEKGNVGATDIIDSQSQGMQRFLTLNNVVIRGLKPITQYYLVDDETKEKFHGVIASKLNGALSLT